MCLSDKFYLQKEYLEKHLEKNLKPSTSFQAEETSTDRPKKDNANSSHAHTVLKQPPAKNTVADANAERDNEVNADSPVVNAPVETDDFDFDVNDFVTVDEVGECETAVDNELVEEEENGVEDDEEDLNRYEQSDIEEDSITANENEEHGKSKEGNTNTEPPDVDMKEQESESKETLPSEKDDDTTNQLSKIETPDVDMEDEQDKDASNKPDTTNPSIENSDTLEESKEEQNGDQGGEGDDQNERTEGVQNDKDVKDEGTKSQVSDKTALKPEQDSVESNIPSIKTIKDEIDPEVPVGELKFIHANTFCSGYCSFSFDYVVLSSTTTEGKSD